MKNNWIALLIAVFMLPIASCKKTDKLAEQVNDQPFLITTNFGLSPWHLPNYSFQRSYLVGDTATLLGKFFPDKPGFQILVGKAAAQIVFKTQVPATGDSALNQYTHQLQKLDYVRFVITAAMGTGSTIPMTITANGVTIQAPSISIQQYLAPSGKTDTTLYVDSLSHWMPADINSYYNAAISFITGQSVSRDGTLCFNDLTDIFTLQQSSISRLIGSGDQLSENGVSFTIHKVLGSVIAIAGDSLTFSAEVLENIPDTASSFIFRLCKMDLASRTIRTINRTLWQKGVGTVDAPPGPTQGAVGSISLVAAYLKTDLTGAIYCINYFGPPGIGFNVTNCYNNGIGTAQPILYQNQLGNICRISAGGQLKSLVTQNNPFNASNYTLPGYPSQLANDYLVSQDGKTLFAVDKINPNFGRIVSLVLLDINEGVPVLSIAKNPNYRFTSYDTSSVTGRGRPSFQWNFYNNGHAYLFNNMFLPDGSMLGDLNQSLVNINMQDQTYYCDAGTEQGLVISSVPRIQNQTTGWAKYVRFNFIALAGVDKSGAVYYFTGAQDYVNGVSFYKLYSKK